MSTAQSTLVAITALASARPPADAPARLVADWYERKAMLLHLIADESPQLSERNMFEAQAKQAHVHAVQLVTDVAGGAR
jgi:hypothetical protein